jgi:hypothetical protein
MRRSNCFLFDYFVGTGEQARKNGQAERSCGPEIDHELKFGGSLYRQIGRLGASQDFIDQDRSVSSNIAARPLATAARAKDRIALSVRAARSGRRGMGVEHCIS